MDNIAFPGQAIVDVAIAGLGPTGLILAHMLGMRGHRVVVIEREPVYYGNARAVYTDDECMRVFQHINCAEEVREKMLQDAPVQFVRRDGSVMAQYFPLKRPFGWPVVNFFYQPYLETTLTELLSRYPNVQVIRGREVIDFDQDDNGVTVTHQITQQYRFSDSSDARHQRQGDRDLQRLQAKYFVGADGGRSLVREKLGIRMTGKSFPEPWLVVDLQQKEGEDALRHLPNFNFVVDPELPVVSCIQPDRFHRFEFMLQPGQTKEYMEQADTVRQHLSRFIDPDKFEVKRKLVYTFNALIVERWRDRRVLLAGDAAHMTPQFMGQGASAGIRDAFNLGWKLSSVLNGQAGDVLLDSYGKERHDHAKAMIDVSVRLKDVVSMTHPIATRLRDFAIRAILATPMLCRWFQEGGFKPRPVYTKGCYLGLPRRKRRGPEGALAPQPDVRLINGHRRLLDEVLGPGFSLIGLGVDPRATLTADNLDWLASVRTCFAEIYPYGQRPQGLRGVQHATPSGLNEIEDVSGEMIGWFASAGFRRDAVAVLRPDRFTFALVASRDLNDAIGALRRQMGAASVAAMPRHEPRPRPVAAAGTARQ